jgi:hypothetical protein
MSVAWYNLVSRKKGQKMTLEEMMNDADAQAFLAEMAELEAMSLIKGGYCPQCEWSQNNCHCEQYGLPLPQ